MGFLKNASIRSSHILASILQSNILKRISVYKTNILRKVLVFSYLKSHPFSQNSLKQPNAFLDESFYKSFPNPLLFIYNFISTA